MPAANDMDLVRDFAHQNSEAAFAELVQRHISLVYSVALRCTSSPEDAQDVTQAVFIILAQKAAGLRERTVLTGWLYETTRFTAMRLLRTKARRAAREQEAYMQSTLNEPDTAGIWRQLAPHLEDAMGRLAERDRTLLALRFYENKTGAEAAAALGIGEDAAHKRTARALEKLRAFFSKRGVTLTAAAIATAVSTGSVQAAPAGLVGTISTMALTKGAAVSSSTLILVKGALKLMAWAKMKTAVLTGSAIILATGATMATVEVLQSAGTPDITGTWMTTLQLAGWGVNAGQNPTTRVVFKVTKVNGSYQATGDSIDQGLKDLPASKFVYEHPSIHVEVAAVGYTFDGKMNRDATEFSGSWKQGAESGPLVFKRTANPPAFPEPVSDDEIVPRAGSDLQGLWKGMIGTGIGALRVSAKIAEPSAGTFRADFFCDSQGGGRQPSTVSDEKSTVKLMPMAGFGMFEGQLGSNRTELVGNWIQGGQRTPTFFKRANAMTDIAGIGAALHLDQSTSTLRIAGVVSNSPTAEAGLAIGTRVLRIDGVPTKEKNLLDCVNLIRGPAGTKVRLELISPDGKATNTVELTRQIIKL